MIEPIGENYEAGIRLRIARIRQRLNDPSANLSCEDRNVIMNYLVGAEKELAMPRNMPTHKAMVIYRVISFVIIVVIFAALFV